MNDINDILNQAIQSHQRGDLATAENLYTQVIQKKPDHSIALHSMAIVAHQNNQNEKAAELIKSVILSDSQNPQFYNTQGIIFEAQGKIDHAIISYEKAISLDPQYDQPHLNLAIALQANADFSKAIQKCCQIIELFGPSPQVYNLMGYCHQQQDQIPQAVESYNKAINLAPDFPEPYNHLATISNQQENFSHAIDYSKRALTLDPNYTEAYNNLAVAQSGIGSFDQAIQNFQKAISMDPQYADAYYNLANCLRRQNKCKESIPLYQKAIQLTPDYANAHWNLAISFLLTGDFLKGWQQYKWRRNPQAKINTYPHHYDKPRWDGSSFEGKTLLVHYEQGYGDSIQFIRYLPMVKQLGTRVILEERQPLFKLLKQIPGPDQFIQTPSDDSGVNVDFDIHISLMDLPCIFNTTLETIPSDVPYLYAEPEKIKHWQNKITSLDFKVALVFAGSPNHGNDHNRSCPLENFSRLSSIEGAKLYSLQKQITPQQKQLMKDIGITDLGEDFNDFSDTAAAIENMDLVISVDTSVLHLAAAMGKPTWALIPFEPDWRWMLNRQDSPWYPTLRLFRQQQRGNWPQVINTIAQQLQILVK